jgi:hypothetical protein
MSYNPCLLEKVFFWPSKLYYPLLAQKKKAFLSTLNVMISQTVRNEYSRFGGHVDIKVSFKILQLKILNEALILLKFTLF